MQPRFSRWPCNTTYQNAGAPCTEPRREGRTRNDFHEYRPCSLTISACFLSPGNQLTRYKVRALVQHYRDVCIGNLGCLRSTFSTSTQQLEENRLELFSSATCVIPQRHVKCEILSGRFVVYFRPLRPSRGSTPKACSRPSLEIRCIPCRPLPVSLAR